MGQPDSTQKEDITPSHPSTLLQPVLLQTKNPDKSKGIFLDIYPVEDFAMEISHKPEWRE